MFIIDTFLFSFKSMCRYSALTVCWKAFWISQTWAYYLEPVWTPVALLVCWDWNRHWVPVNCGWASSRETSSRLVVALPSILVWLLPGYLSRRVVVCALCLLITTHLSPFGCAHPLTRVVLATAMTTTTSTAYHLTICRPFLSSMAICICALLEVL